jgi:hypothetical protein
MVYSTAIRGSLFSMNRMKFYQKRQVEFIVFGKKNTANQPFHFINPLTLEWIFLLNSYLSGFKGISCFDLTDMVHV